MKSNSQILNVGMAVIISILLLSLAFGIEDNESFEFNEIDITGNIYQSDEQYFKFANLQQCIDQNLPVQIIRDRLEKHPYIERAEITFEGDGLVSANIIEKKFKAIIISENKQYYLTKNFEALPIIGKIQQTDYPLISNIKLNNDKGFIASVKYCDDLKTAVKIIDAVKFMNPEMHGQISEVDLCFGNNIALYFNSLNYPVVFGKNNGTRKVVYLNKLWKQLNRENMGNMINYIDLSFEEKVYLGLTEEYLEDKDKRS
jgi:cell division septal protein FtsQ